MKSTKSLKIKGFTLIEILVSMGVAAILLTGLLGVVRKIGAVEKRFGATSDLLRESGIINRMLRDDLTGIELSVAMDRFTDTNGDGFFNVGEGFSNGDDPSTSRLSYAPALNRDEATGPPGNDPSTPYNETDTDNVNLPYGTQYDYFFGITNNGHRDVLSFRANVGVGREIQNAMVTYRLVERSHQCNGDTGSDLLEDEFEPGHHPLYNPDPHNDNFSGVFKPGSVPPGREEREGDGVSENLSFSCPDGGRKPQYQFQRILSLSPDEQHLEVISRSVVSFNLLYYDREAGRYIEPTALVKTFGYKDDGTDGTLGTFDSTGLFTSASTTLTEGLLLNLKIGDPVYLEQSGAIAAGLYRMTEKQGKGLRFDLLGQSPSTTTTTTTTTATAAVTFRAAYFPAALKVILTLKGETEGLSDPRTAFKTVPITIFLGDRG